MYQAFNLQVFTKTVNKNLLSLLQMAPIYPNLSQLTWIGC
jgi:hypothetical protein